MAFVLVVISPFGAHGAGDVISDPDAVEQALQFHADRVVRTVAPQPANSRED